MIDVTMLSGTYRVRRLDDADADAILGLYRGNDQFYRYSRSEPTRDQVLSDLHVAPPGIGAPDKYYVGFFSEDSLIAVMDLIAGYPRPGTAFIGLFMMDKEYQGRQLGTSIVREVEAYLRRAGMTSIRLGIDKGNPQSTHFWDKNGFVVVDEVDRDGSAVLVAEKAL